MPLARELAKGGIKLLKNAKPTAKVVPKVPAKQTAGSKAAPAKAPPSVPRKQTDAEIAKMEQQKAVASAEKARDARWAMESEASLRRERYQAQQNSKELWKYKEAEAAKKATKARRVETAKSVAKGTGKAAAGTTVGVGVMETATEGNFSKEVFGRKDKPTKASPKTRRAGKPMKGTK
jgi:hypothetical protein